MTPIRVAFHTLGCKLNQLETESLADAFLSAGATIVPFSTSADLYVVNTCTVTGKAEQKARRVVRQALASGDRSVVLVTGCYAQMEPEAVGALGERTVVVPGDEKQTIPDLAGFLTDNWQGHGDLLDLVLEWRSSSRPGLAQAAASPSRGRFVYRPETFTYHSRPSLKIQDGCDNRCSYCRVCLARGPSVSLSAQEALRRVLHLESAGRAEVVLTGVNLSQYRDGDENFAGLLRVLTQGTTTIAFRISSFEPDRVDGEFLEAFAHPRVRPHVHLALQSGSDSVLGRMRRRYNAEKILSSIEKIRSVKDDPFIAADVIAGFPGETDEEFAQTLELCRSGDLAWIHAFPFSARPGTPAFDMRPLVPERIAGERVAALSELARRRHSDYIDRWIGKTTEVMLEGNTSGKILSLPGAEPDTDEAARAHSGTSSNYLKLSVSGLADSARPGQSHRVRIVSRSDDEGLDAQAKAL